MDTGVTQVQVSNNYDEFHFIESNREQSRAHVEALKKAFEEMGNLTRVQPILVNERMQIIDGQHRFVACKELGQPIYFTQVEGLNIRDARQMNILHRGWKMEDWAKSYASTGDVNYQKYLNMKEDYGFNNSIILHYIHGGETSNPFAEFKSGEFVIPDEKAARERLNLLASMGEFVPVIHDRYFSRAFLRVLNVEGYDHKRMLKKLEMHQNLIRRYASVEEYLRMLEEIYNYQITESNRLRLY